MEEDYDAMRNFASYTNPNIIVTKIILILARIHVLNFACRTLLHGDHVFETPRS